MQGWNLLENTAVSYPTTEKCWLAGSWTASDVIRWINDPLWGEGVVSNCATSLPFQMQDTSRGQCKTETVYSCQIEDGFVLGMTDTSEVPFSLLIWVLSDTQHTAHSAAANAWTYIPLLLLCSRLLPQVLAAFFTWLLKPAQQVHHLHFPILCVPAPFSACNPFLLPGQWDYVPAPHKHCTFPPFPLGLKSCPWGCILFHSYHITHKNRHVILVDKNLGSDRSCFVLVSLQFLWAK